MTIKERIAAEIAKANSIAIVCHTNPDGDTVGSALALYHAIIGTGKQVAVLCDSALPQNLSALTHADIFGVGEGKRYDLAIAVDVSAPHMAGECYRVLREAGMSICIDHHSSHEKMAKLEWVQKAAANAELIYELLADCYADRLDVHSATHIYTALVTDTGGFSYDCVTAHTHTVAGACLALGAPGADICYLHLSKLPTRVVKMRSVAYSRALYEAQDRLVLVVFSRELLDKYNGTLEDMAGSLVDVMRGDTVQVGVALVEVSPRQYKVSIRSKGRVSAARIAESFGGGGHYNAAGCRLAGDEGIVLDRLIEAAWPELE